jgi:hypothetical protein
MSKTQEFHHAPTGSVAYAADLVGLSRNTLYRRRQTDPAFAAGWAEAIASAADRLNEEAMRRSVSGNGRAAFRRGRRLGSIREYDSGLLIRLLRLHWPATYTDKADGPARRARCWRGLDGSRQVDTPEWTRKDDRFRVPL